MTRSSLSLLACLLVIAPAVATPPEPTLCRGNERVWFHCPVDRKPVRYLALCGAAELGTTGRTLQYRYGRPDQVELAYPQETMAADDAFTLTIEFSPDHIRQTSSASLEFQRGDYRYQLFEDYFDATIDQQGLVVTLPDGTESWLLCNRPAEGSLHDLLEMLTAAEDDS